MSNTDMGQRIKLTELLHKHGAAKALNILYKTIELHADGTIALGFALQRDMTPAEDQQLCDMLNSLPGDDDTIHAQWLAGLATPLYYIAEAQIPAAHRDLTVRPTEVPSDE